jgi:hypothetical protein
VVGSVFWGGGLVGASGDAPASDGHEEVGDGDGVGVDDGEAESYSREAALNIERLPSVAGNIVEEATGMEQRSAPDY